MRLYRVRAVADFNGAPGRSVWVGSKANVPAAKRELRDMASGNLKISTVEVEEHDVPTSKAGLTDWLNEHVGGI